MHPTSIVPVIGLTMLTAMSYPQRATATQRDFFPPYLTAEIFIAEYRGTPHPAAPGAGSAYNAAHAAGYLAAVADLGHGRTWCLPSGTAPAEADSQVVTALSHKVASEHRSLPTHAGALLLAQYAASFPLKNDCMARSRLSASAFLTQLTGVGQNTPSRTTLDSSQTSQLQRYAEGYSAGVIDATQGSSWCAPRRLKPMAVESRMLSELDRRHGAGKLSGNAGAILLDIYESIFPCQRSQVRR